MSVVSLSLFKANSNIDAFNGEDDTYLQHLLDAAEEAVVNATHRKKDELLSMGDGAFPAPITQAVLMLAGHFYEHRETSSAVAMHVVPYSLQALIEPYCRYAKEEET